MPLIACPDCSKAVSDQAILCPNCGYPLHPNIKTFTIKALKTVTEYSKNLFSCLLSLILLIISLGIISFFVILAFRYFSEKYNLF